MIDEVRRHLSMGDIGSPCPAGRRSNGFRLARLGNNAAGAPDMISRRQPVVVATVLAVVLTVPTVAAGGPQRLPVVLPQCVAGYFAPGVVTPSDAEFAGPTDVNAETANR